MTLAPTINQTMIDSHIEATVTKPKSVVNTTSSEADVQSKKKEGNLRSIVKSISWRAVGTLDTIIISLLLTGELTLAFAIGTIEVITKMTLYFFHERAWNLIKWGAADEDGGTKEKGLRSLAKTVSWRTVGSIDTIIISLLVTGDLTVAFAIGSIEVVTKMTLYFFHERLWNSIKWGKS